ncbi:MAG: hypothetical protein R3F11_01120 [Verrucomicrobiales bacterium]
MRAAFSADLRAAFAADLRADFPSGLPAFNGPFWSDFPADLFVPGPDPGGFDDSGGFADSADSADSADPAEPTVVVEPAEVFAPRFLEAGFFFFGRVAVVGWRAAGIGGDEGTPIA